MDKNDEVPVISKEMYYELLQKLKAEEREKNKLARELRSMQNQYSIVKLTAQTQSNINKRLASEKQKQEIYVQLLLEFCPDIIFVIDENMRFLLGTNSITDIIAVDDPYLLQGRELDSIVARFHPPAFTEAMVSSVKNIVKNAGDDKRTEKKLEIDTGMNKYEASILPFYQQDTGIFLGALIVMHDITELSRAKEFAEQAKELAEQASSAKGDFLSRMSHEMRTPMNAIIGMTNIAKGSNDPEKKEYCLGKIEDASKHLLNVINDILDMSKIEANKFDLSYQEFDFENTLMKITNIINFRIEEKKQNFIVNLDRSVPLSLISDELRLTQVITNLLSNSAKFTPEGGTISLNITKLSDSGSDCTLRFEVIDNGIGISADQQSRLFRSFEQADGSITRKYGGTGLGLAISKRIVELMNGSIWVESELGKGSKFIFTIKAEKGTTKRERHPVINKEEIHILAVDDSKEIRDYFTYVMSTFELSCDVAADGYEALQMIADSKDNPYNIFFIDWQMPGINGIELTKKIKETAMDNAIVFMISVAKWSDIEEEAEAAGVDRFVSKPLFPSVLIDSINECFGAVYNEKTISQTRSPEDQHDFRSHTLLLAEDIEVNREIIMAILEDTGITIDSAENGLEAVALFEKQPDKYSLILMDVNMPEMDGYDATRKIRSLNCQEARNIPIIAMTANVFREDIEHCIEAGMNDHIGKPLDTDDLYKKLDLYLPKTNHAEAAKNTPSPVIDPAEPAEHIISYEELTPYIDVQGGIARLMNNEKLYYGLLNNFSGRKMADDIIESIQASDYFQTQQTAHALKGVSANLGLTELMNISSTIEAQAKMSIDSFPAIDSLNKAVDTVTYYTKLLSEGKIH